MEDIEEFKETSEEELNTTKTYHSNGNIKTDTSIGLTSGKGFRLTYNEEGFKEREEHGVFKNEVLEGEGTLKTYYPDGSPQAEFKGNFVNGKPNGEGVFKAELPKEAALLSDYSSTESKGTFKDGELVSGEISYLNLFGSVERTQRVEKQT